MLWNEARMNRTSSGIKDCVRGKWAKGSTSGVWTSRRTGSTTASRPMGRKSLPLGDVGDVGEHFFRRVFVREYRVRNALDV